MIANDAQLLRELRYDPSTGEIRWTVAKPSKKAGSLAGRVGSQGYIEIRNHGRILRAHRVAFLLTNGFWPDGVVDHVNGDRSDNRWGNLRVCTHAENLLNQKLAVDNSHGFKGVTQHRGKWQAYISINGKNTYLGVYATAEAAHAAYCVAAETHHGQFARVA